MKKKKRAALHKKQSAKPHPRAVRVYRRSFAEMRAEAMDSALTPTGQAAWNKLHYRHD